MIAYRGMPKTTPADFERMDRLRELDCMCCAIKGDLPSKRVEIHHVKQGNSRLGHLYTIPLCPAHHRGERGELGTQEISVHGSGMKAFRKRWGYSDLQLWQKLQVTLGLDDSLPTSKIYKRTIPQTEAEVSR